MKIRIADAVTGLLLALITFPVFAAVDRLRLATQEWAPYQYSTADGGIHGLATDRVRCALGKMQQPYQIAFMEWSKAQLEVRQGAFDGFFVASRNDTRDKYATLSDTVAQQQWVLYSFQDVDNNQFATMDYKEGISVAATFGSAKWFWLKKNGYRVDKYPKDTRRLVDLLLERKVGAILETREVMEQEMQRRGLKLDSFNQLELYSNELGVYFSNEFLGRNPGFLQRFNQALKSCPLPATGVNP
ncbi:substrate-binding periplasmic protein [Spongorhabdus nitratireducens]